MPRKRCTGSPLCPNEREPGSTRCAEHGRMFERQRGTAKERGYGSKRWSAARKATLRRDPICVVNGPSCTLISTVADHFPESRRELVARGVRDPDAPKFLRGVCHNCHSAETARLQPGGWNVQG